MSSFVIHTLTILGQTSAPTTAPTSGNPPPWASLISSPMFLILLLLMVMLLFTSNSKRKQERERQAVLKGMKRGDKVQTIGGIIGTVVDVRDADVVVKVDEGNNTKIKFSRSAVSRVLGDDEKSVEKK